MICVYQKVVYWKLGFPKQTKNGKKDQKTCRTVWSFTIVSILPLSIYPCLFIYQFFLKCQCECTGQAHLGIPILQVYRKYIWLEGQVPGNSTYQHARLNEQQ